MSQSNRSAWDAGRFLQTLNFFDTIPVLNCVRKMFFGAPASPLPPEPLGGVLFDFSRPAPTLQQIWGALDDVVMGGVSNSTFQLGEGAARFIGTVSTANSGGFASVRTRNFEPPLNLEGYSGIRLSVLGDGKRYKFLVRDEGSWDSLAYTQSFDTVANAWITVEIPFAQMKPVFRAKTVATARPIDQTQIRSFQLMLSKFEYDGALNPHFSPGEFCLQVRAIAVY